MRIYLSGPITGQANYRRVFNEAKTILEAQGYKDIINPAELCQVLPETYPYEKILNLCLDMLAECDVLVLLPGWQQSHGCGMEIGYARAMDLIEVEFEDFVKRG